MLTLHLHRPALSGVRDVGVIDVVTTGVAPPTLIADADRLDRHRSGDRRPDDGACEVDVERRPRQRGGLATIGIRRREQYLDQRIGLEFGFLPQLGHYRADPEPFIAQPHDVALVDAAVLVLDDVSVLVDIPSAFVLLGHPCAVQCDYLPLIVEYRRTAASPWAMSLL